MEKLVDREKDSKWRNKLASKNNLTISQSLALQVDLLDKWG